jgi:WD40 repeat protein
MAFSADGRYLASGAMDKQAIVWNVESDKPVANLKNIPDTVSAVAFLPDGEYLATGAGGVIHIWRISSEVALCTIRGHRGDIDEMIFSPDSRLLISHSEDGTVRIWGLP